MTRASRPTSFTSLGPHHIVELDFIDGSYDFQSHVWTAPSTTVQTAGVWDPRLRSTQVRLCSAPFGSVRWFLFAAARPALGTLVGVFEWQALCINQFSGRITKAWTDS